MPPERDAPVAVPGSADGLLDAGFPKSGAGDPGPVPKTPAPDEEVEPGAPALG